MASELKAEVPFKIERANLVNDENGIATPEQDPLLQLARLIGDESLQGDNRVENPESDFALDMEAQLMRELAVGDAADANADSPQPVQVEQPSLHEFLANAEPEPAPLGEAVEPATQTRTDMDMFTELQDALNAPVAGSAVDNAVPLPENNAQIASDLEAEFEKAFEQTLSDPAEIATPVSFEFPAEVSAQVPEPMGSFTSSSPAMEDNDFLNQPGGDVEVQQSHNSYSSQANEFANAFKQELAAVSSPGVSEDSNAQIDNALGQSFEAQQQESDFQAELAKSFSTESMEMPVSEPFVVEPPYVPDADPFPVQNTLEAANEAPAPLPDPLRELEAAVKASKMEALSDTPVEPLPTAAEISPSARAVPATEVPDAFEMAMAQLSDSSPFQQSVQEPVSPETEPVLARSFLEIVDTNDAAEPSPVEFELDKQPAERDDFQLNTGGIEIGMSALPTKSDPPMLDPIEAALKELAGGAHGAGSPQSASAVSPSLGFPSSQPDQPAMDEAFGKPSNSSSTGVIAAGAAAIVAARKDGQVSQPDQPNSFSPVIDPQPAMQSVEPSNAFDFDISQAPETEFKPEENNRNGIRAATIVAAIAILGGAGALAWNMLGGDTTNGPAKIVLASSDPVKVKPEKPGGQIIPNQNQAVYNEISGTNAAGAGQDSLKSGAEEPLDVAPFSPKSSERLGASNTNTAGARDSLTITPRRVRTVVVKPDGTIVSAPPRPTPSAGNAEATRIAALETPGPKRADDGGLIRAVEIPSPTMTPAAEPETAGLESKKLFEGGSMATGSIAVPNLREPVIRPVKSVPAKPVEVAIAPKPPAPKKPVAAVKKPAAKTTQNVLPAGTWVMQVSSQRSAEAAQSTYNSLKRRFASVLGGRGVDIRRAKIAGKGVFYRVRIPAGSKRQAAALCKKYKSAGGSCYITR